VHRFRTWQLFAICVLIWGTTWFAITLQIGHLPPEVAVAMRFGLAGGVVLGMCALRGLPMRFGLRDHALLWLQGGFMFGLSYICFYHAEKHVVSGLVAVGSSASALASGIGARLAFGTRLGTRFVLGGLLGIAGVALIFWPEFGIANAAGGGNDGNTDGGIDGRTALGAALTVAAVVFSAIGSLTASRNRRNGLPFWPSLGFGMLYGAGTAAAVALAQGTSFALPDALSWWLSLIYLSLAGSVMTFACFLTLQERLGPGPSGTVGVMTPLIALLVSLVFEAFEPDAFTFAGAALAVIGNALMLNIGWRGKRIESIA
jgi:drug/metabolite transporter (DMT)-like permease